MAVSIAVFGIAESLWIRSHGVKLRLDEAIDLKQKNTQQWSAGPAGTIGGENILTVTVAESILGLDKLEVTRPAIGSVSKLESSALASSMCTRQVHLNSHCGSFRTHCDRSLTNSHANKPIEISFAHSL